MNVLARAGMWVCEKDERRVQLRAETGRQTGREALGLWRSEGKWIVRGCQVVRGCEPVGAYRLARLEMRQWLRDGESQNGGRGCGQALRKVRRSTTRCLAASLFRNRGTGRQEQTRVRSVVGRNKRWCLPRLLPSTSRTQPRAVSCAVDQSCAAHSSVERAACLSWAGYA